MIDYTFDIPFFNILPEMFEKMCDMKADFGLLCMV